MFQAFRTPPKKTIVAIAAAASLTLMAGCSDDDTASTSPPAESSAGSSAPSQPAEASTSSTPSESAAPESPDKSQDNQALMDAGDLALQQVQDSTLISIETENNETEWEVQVVTSDGVEHEMNISADGTEVVKKPKTKDEGEGDKLKHQDRVKAAKIDFKQAAKKITDEVKGGRITELNLDGEGSKTVWEADVKVDSEKRSLQIDAGSGDVLKNRVDS